MEQMTASPDRAPAAALERLDFGAPAELVGEICRRDGGLILSGAITRDEVDTINRDLDAVMEPLSGGSFAEGEENKIADFLGTRTKRLPHIVKYSETYRNRVLNREAMMGYVAQTVPGQPGTHSLYASHAIEILPGETAQDLHRDGGGLHLMLGLDNAKAPSLVVNAILALVDITEEMGATRVVPGSHLWDDYSHFPTQQASIPVLLNAGDIFFFTGKVLHGGGSNTTADAQRRVISSTYSVPFFMGEEAWPFVLTVDEVRTYPALLQKMLGFRSVSYRGEEPGFLWRADTRPLEDFLGL